MKPLLVMARITFVGCLWSIIFIEGVRVIMLESWRFDIFWPPHWFHAWNLWSSGWVIDTPKEWAFILIIITFIPMLLTGWIALSLVPWERLLWKAVLCPINLLRSIWKPIKIVSKQPVIVKRKSYKEIRPTGPRAPIYDYNDSLPPRSDAVSAGSPHTPPVSVEDNESAKNKTETSKGTFTHSLFNLDDEDDSFDLDFDSFEKSDIFEIDSNKKKEETTEASEKKDNRRAKNDRVDFEDEDDEDYYVPQSRHKESGNYRNNRRYEEDDDYQPRRRSYDDNDEDNNNSRRRNNKNYTADNSPGGRKNEGRRERRDDNRSNSEAKNDYRRDNKADNRRITKDKNTLPQYSNPVADILTQKGYDVISNINIKNTLIDFVGISEDRICLCFIDKEFGDWLADEERFNDEEPLWFSESSHRISPVRKVDLASQALADKLENNNYVDFEIKPFVIIQMGNIINAEDMFDVWNDIGVEVTRINRGSPKEIKLFSKSLKDADRKLSKNKLETLKKLIRNIM